ncbi:DivIVA domain-containing protein [Actinoplanes sp. NPDC024001]|uniref:DivIVA domain-containing protein n=1 Tax=Actinoplanes sp. NPDC024001 TaxID=3154598 RepID=UPI0033FD074F
MSSLPPAPSRQPAPTAAIAVPITSHDVDRVEFRPPPPGSRGYHDGEVDDFLAEVAAEMRRLTAENEALSEQLQYADLRKHLTRWQERCARAQEHARVLQAELERARAGAVEPEADPQAVLELAERTADGCLAEARDESAEVIGKATTEAARLLSDAELRASTIVADARHKHAERLAELPGKRAAALDRIEELREEAERRREAVTDEVNRRLRDLTGGGDPAR